MYLETSDRRSLFQSRPFRRLLVFRKATRKDPAACVSLSSYSLVKQPGNREVPYPLVTQRAIEARHPRTIGCRFTVPVRSFRGAPSRRNAVQRADGPYIGQPTSGCQPRKSRFFDPVIWLLWAFARPPNLVGESIVNDLQMPHSGHIHGSPLGHLFEGWNRSPDGIRHPTSKATYDWCGSRH